MRRSTPSNVRAIESVRRMDWPVRRSRIDTLCALLIATSIPTAQCATELLIRTPGAERQRTQRECSGGDPHNRLRSKPFGSSSQNCASFGAATSRSRHQFPYSEPVRRRGSSQNGTRGRHEGANHPALCAPPAHCGTAYPTQNLGVSSPPTPWCKHSSQGLYNPAIAPPKNYAFTAWEYSRGTLSLSLFRTIGDRCKIRPTPCQGSIMDDERPSPLVPEEKEPATTSSGPVSLRESAARLFCPVAQPPNRRSRVLA